MWVGEVQPLRNQDINLIIRSLLSISVHTRLWKGKWLEKQSLQNLAYVEQIFGLYNSRRPHLNLGFRAPNLVHHSGNATRRKRKATRLNTRDKRCPSRCPRGGEIKG